MRAFQAAGLTLLWITGALSTACAQSQETRPEPAYAQEPPTPPKPPPPPGRDPEERRERIRRLEVRIHELEDRIDGKGASEEQRKEWRVQLEHSRADLKELLADRPRQDEGRRDLQEKMRRLEGEMRELELALENKDAKPEERKRLEDKLERARGEMRNLQSNLSKREGRPKDSRDDMLAMERIAERIRTIDDLMRGGIGPEDKKELMAERNKLQDELRRRNEPQHGGPMGGQGPMGGPGQSPPDPETMKLHRQAMELERQSMDLSAHLRSLPKDSKDRAELAGKLKETVVQLFDIREKARAREVDMIKKRLEELTQLLEKRKANRDAIIEKRLKQLSGESDELDW